MPLANALRSERIAHSAVEAEVLVAHFAAAAALAVAAAAAAAAAGRGHFVGGAGVLGQLEDFQRSIVVLKWIDVTMKILYCTKTLTRLKKARIFQICVLRFGNIAEF